MSTFFEDGLHQYVGNQASFLEKAHDIQLDRVLRVSMSHHIFTTHSKRHIYPRRRWPRKSIVSLK